MPGSETHETACVTVECGCAGHLDLDRRTVVIDHLCYVHLTTVPLTLDMATTSAWQDRIAAVAASIRGAIQLSKQALSTD